MQIRDTGRLYAAFGALVIVAVVNSCTSDNIRSDYDPAANFGHYKTYDFFPGAGPDESAYESVFSKYMIEAISIEMEKRGYVKSSDPDLLINFNAILREKSRVISSPPPLVGGYYGYRSGYYDPWLGYGYTQQYYVLQYTEGTFNIDLVDARRKRLVWEAVGQGQVSQKDLEELDDRVYETLP
jgi:hypothetical protein